jgi:hypothetical protein
MKTTILTTAIALSIVFGISRPAQATTGDKTEISTVLTDVRNISEIEVRGNVQLYLTSSNEDKVKVADDYYTDGALVQEHDGILRITSYATEKLVVWVSVNNLSKLSVFDNAVVKSFGKFSAIDLDVNLHNNALARLDMEVFDASFTLTGRAKADLSGFVENSTLKYDRSSYLNVADFTAAHLSKTLISKPAARFSHPFRHPHFNEGNLGVHA